jgi:hypothetical protein
MSTILATLRAARAELHQAESYSLLQRLSNVSILLRLWQYPTFESSRSWTLISADQGLLVRRMVLTQAETAPSTIIGSEAYVQLALWKHLRRELYDTRIYPTPGPESAGRDGTHFGLVCRDAHSHIELEWHNETPDGWSGVRAFWHNAVSAFEKRLPAHRAR